MRGPCIPRPLGFQIYLNNCLALLLNSLIFVDLALSAFLPACCLNARATRAARSPNQRRPLMLSREATVRVRRSAPVTTGFVNKVSTQISSHSTKISQQSGVLLATARIYSQGPNGDKLFVRALVDLCSQISIITQSLCNLLSLKCKPTPSVFKGWERPAAIPSKVSQLSIQSHFQSSSSFNFEVMILLKLSSYRPPIIQKVQVYYLSY